MCYWGSIQKFKINKAAGFDDLSSNIIDAYDSNIIDAYDSLKNILLHVFKVSIQQGIFPDSIRISKVTPKKTRERTNPEEARGGAGQLEIFKGRGGRAVF